MSCSREYHRNYSRDYYHKRMSDIKSLMGGECCICGSTENLEIHHINPSEKEFSISKKVLSIPQSKIIDELYKCELLCKRCHKIISSFDAKERSKSAIPRLALISSRMRKKIRCLSDGSIYESSKECADKYDLARSSISRVCRGERKSVHGLSFEYIQS